MPRKRQLPAGAEIGKLLAEIDRMHPAHTGPPCQNAQGVSADTGPVLGACEAILPLPVPRPARSGPQHW